MVGILPCVTSIVPSIVAQELTVVLAPVAATNTSGPKYQLAHHAQGSIAYGYQ